MVMMTFVTHPSKTNGKQVTTQLRQFAKLWTDTKSHATSQEKKAGQNTQRKQTTLSLTQPILSTPGPHDAQ